MSDPTAADTMFKWLKAKEKWIAAIAKAKEINEERRPLIEAWERYEKWLDLKKQMEELEKQG